MTPHEKFDRVIAAGLLRARTPEGRRQIEDMSAYPGYAEPGYDEPKAGLVVIGNYSTITRRNPETRRYEDVDGAPEWVGDTLEELGFGAEWQDEWVACDDCSKIFRTETDGSGWMRFGVVEPDCLCGNCIDPELYLTSLEGQAGAADTIRRINPAEHGYVLLIGKMESGMHSGQDADPKVIARTLCGLGIERFLFKLESSNPFTATFGVWLHEDEKGRLEESTQALLGGGIDGPSISEGFKKALRSAAVTKSTLPGSGGVVYIRPDHETGTARVMRVAQEDLPALMRMKELPPEEKR